MQSSPAVNTATVADAPSHGGDHRATSVSLSPVVTPRAADEYRRRMRAMYLKYDPGQVHKVEVALERYRGYEEDVLQQLVKRYGPEPPPSESQQWEAGPSTAASRGDGGPADPAQVSPRDVGEENRVAAAGNPTTALSETAQVAGSYSERLSGMYLVYDPQKLRLVEGTLKRYKGREEAALQQLVKIYGPEPSPERVAAAKTAAAATVSTISAEAPEAPAPSLPSPSQPASTETVATLRRAEGFAPPAQAPPPGAAGAAHQGGSAEPAAVVVGAAEAARPPSSAERKQPGSPVSSRTASPTEAAAVGGRYRERLVALYHAYNPAKLHTVEGTLKKFAGKEEVAIQQLVRRYGAEPPPLSPEESRALLSTPVSVSAATITAAGNTAASMSGDSKPVSPVQPTTEHESLGSPRQRIVAILAAHEPDKVDRVDRILDTYKGREEEVIAKLQMRYAPQRRTSASDPLLDSPAKAHAAATLASQPAAVAPPAPPAPAAPPAPETVPLTPVIASLEVITENARTTLPAAPPPPPPVAATAPPSQRSSSRDSAAVPSSKPTVVSAAAAPPAPAPAPAAPEARRSPAMHRAALRLAAAHVEGIASRAVQGRYWAMWQAHHAKSRAAALLERGLWVATVGSAAGHYQLNDSAEPSYVVRSLTAVAAQEGSRTRAFSSEMQLAARALVASLRHCIESRVVEVQSGEEQQLADTLLHHWARTENFCPVTDSPELARALHQAAHLVEQLQELTTVIRTQAGQLQQLKALHRDVLERMEHAQAETEAVESLHAQLDAANHERHVLAQELQRVKEDKARPSATQAPPPRRYPTVEERKDGQIAKLQQELSKARNCLFLSKEAEEKMRVQLQHSRAREARREHEHRHREGTNARYSSSSPVQGRSRSARAGGAVRASLSDSPHRHRTPVSTPRGAFSQSIAQATPRRSSHPHPHLNGTAISSIRKPDAAVATAQERVNTSFNSSGAPWPASRYVTPSVEVERGPCPNCLTPLTSCCRDRDGAAVDKAAFCFSCRRSFSFGDLHQRDAREAVDHL
ncbi:hypothetical protein NESM_000032500 [Novymonas esmeraldas]|uniref:Uncharacterized protein n=1 Tax=Novymonas esmeraldas TaxID=1808958 RepID=A0AAW0EZX2_9TRYP